MKKGLLMLLAGFMALGASVKVYADARIDAMSTDVREVEDLDLIWLYPNKIMDYKNTVDFRLFSNAYNSGHTIYGLGDGTNEWGGVIADETAALGGVVGVYVNRPYDSHTDAHGLTSGINISGGSPWIYIQDPFRTLTSAAGNLNVFKENNDFDLFYATGIGGGNFGVHLNYTDNGLGQGSNSFPPDFTEWQQDQLALSLGLGLEAVGPFSQLNIHVDYGMQSITNTAAVTVSKDKDNGVNTIKLGALGQSDLSDTSYVRTFIDATLDQDNLNDLSNKTFDYNDTTLLLGAAINHKVNSGKGLVSTGLVIDYVGASNKDTSGTSTVTDDWNSWNLYWNGSVESQVADWLTLRAGIEKALVARVYDSADAPNSYWDNANANVAFSTGFGINWQNFTLNAKVTAESLESSIANVAPGSGLLIAGSIVQVSAADLSYKF